MIGTDLREAVALVEHSDPAPFEAYEFVDFRVELERLLTKARASVTGTTKRIFVTFGYPGNGKGAFAREACRRLHDEGFAILWLDVGALVACQEDVVRQYVSEANGILESDRVRPLVFVIRDLDLLKPGLEENPALIDLRELLALCSTSRCKSPLFVLVSATSPAQAIRELGPVDPPSLQFFNWPNESKAEELFGILDLPQPGQIASDLFDSAIEHRVRYTAGTLVNGARQAMRVAFSPVGAEVGSGSPQAAAPIKQVTHAIRTFCVPTAEDEVKSYLYEHREYIARAI